MKDCEPPGPFAAIEPVILSTSDTSSPSTLELEQDDNQRAVIEKRLSCRTDTLFP